tara:strand:+ start:479 stop:877 length:399 start_codon:yes stop_codon:yes gene_type:complete
MLKVGNIIYLLDKKTQGIVPCRVVERITSVSLEGETLTHIVESPTGKQVKIEDYKNPWFETMDSAREFLLNSATSLIDSTLEATRAAEEKYFKTSNFDQIDQIDVSDNISDNEVTIELADGQKARVNLPEGF